MRSSLQQWESDPLFSAAEVIQDSVDRMESIFRLLLHEQSLVQGDHSDPRLLTQIEFHRRDLQTILETAKWQLEDFERAVSSSAMMDKSSTKEYMVSRHNQFIKAIREQINYVEETLGEQPMGNSVKNSDWVDLNEQDRDGLALFLSGGNPTEPVNHYDLDDSNILKRFLDPASTSGSKDGGMVADGSGEIEELNTISISNIDNYYDSKDHNLRKVGSSYSTKLSLDAFHSSQEASTMRNIEDSSWDLEACEGKAKSFFQNNKSRGYYSRKNFFCFPNNLLNAFGSKVARDYTKRLKDGDEQEHLPLFSDISAQGQHREEGLAHADCSRLWTRFQACNAIFYRVQLSQRSMQIILSAVCSLIILGILIHQFA
ncbi:hypothetical protein SLA2020_147610 [Shorea laevis]